MTIVPFQQLACPLDGLPLIQEGRSWCCDSGHSYDIARQGYTHLLPIQNTRSRNPGDSKEMIDVRQRFLNEGFYHPISQALNQMVFSGLPTISNILDAGCGEGYYLRQLAANVQPGKSLHLLGLDISKPAILSAAKQDKRANWVVASNANIPVLSESIDRLICMFGFPVYSEFARVLKAQGELVMVEPGPDHLQELREIIYPVLKPQKQKEAFCPAGFEIQRTETLSYQLDLTNAQQINDLLVMTPHFFRASAQGKEKAAKLNSLKLTVNVQLNKLKKS